MNSFFYLNTNRKDYIYKHMLPSALGKQTATSIIKFLEKENEFKLAKISICENCDIKLGSIAAVRHDFDIFRYSIRHLCNRCADKSLCIFNGSY